MFSPAPFLNAQTGGYEIRNAPRSFITLLQLMRTNICLRKHMRNSHLRKYLSSSK